MDFCNNSWVDEGQELEWETNFIYTYLCAMAKLGNDLASMRVEFEKSTLMEKSLCQNPFDQFELWLEEAKNANPYTFNAFTLATVSKSGFPHGRVVLLKGVEARTLVFFTNYESQKARDMEFCKKVSASFFWPELERQVLVHGVVEKISSAESDAYFQSRPRASQIGAHASQQSRSLSSRKELEDRVAHLTQEFEGKEIPRPEHWGGYAIIPHYFEFWQGRASRLHDRFVYQEDADGAWPHHRISP